MLRNSRKINIYYLYKLTNTLFTLRELLNNPQAGRMTQRLENIRFYFDSLFHISQLSVRNSTNKPSTESILDRMKNPSPPSQTINMPNIG
ncbi:hypothetical protein SPWS13_1408 [Shewanella putrefaciens]|nr:hypothetical protein SPWS13_1408 [Shewanella putrefaciens]